MLLLISKAISHINDRTEGGHWEGDLMILQTNRPVLVLVERKSRFTSIISRLKSKDAADAGWPNETVQIKAAMLTLTYLKQVSPTLQARLLGDTDPVHEAT